MIILSNSIAPFSQIPTVQEPVNTLYGKRREQAIGEGKHMSSDLEFAWGNAWSFSDKHRPNRADYIGKVTKGNREYLFYKDANNQYWYESRTIKN